MSPSLQLFAEMAESCCDAFNSSLDVSAVAGTCRTVEQQFRNHFNSSLNLRTVAWLESVKTSMVSHLEAILMHLDDILSHLEAILGYVRYTA